MAVRTGIQSNQRRRAARGLWRTRRGEILFQPELLHTGTTDAGAVAQIFRHARKQLRWKILVGAPALAFVSNGRAEQARVRASTQGAARRIKGLRMAHRI